MDLRAVVNIDEIQRLLVEQDDAMAHTLMAVTGAVRNSFEADLTEAQMLELLQNYEAVLRSCDRFYEATSLVLQEHIMDMRGKRQCLTDAIANMAEMNGNGEGFLKAKQDGVELGRATHLRLIDD